MFSTFHPLNHNLKLTFNPGNHSYIDSNDITYTSVTTLISKYFPQFDTELMAENPKYLHCLFNNEFILIISS